MRKIEKMLTGILSICFVLLALSLPLCVAEASGDILPTAQDNTGINLRRTSGLVAVNNGYMRVYYTGEKIGIEYYDNNFNITEKRMLDMELGIWGGFYAGSDAYYIVEGQNNIAESDSAEVIRVIKYDNQWNKKGTARITGNTNLFGGEVRYPFNYGCVEMTEYNGTLYIVTGHEGYVDPEYHQGHQGFLMIAVDEETMSGEIVNSDLWHSFAQYIESDDSNLYVLEQSEGSRYTKLSKYDPKNLESNSLPVLKYGGARDSAWAIACYASVDGMSSSSNNVLCLGTSIDQSKYDNVSSDTAHNIYLTVTPKTDFSESSTKVRWITNYIGGSKAFMGTKITKINDNRFMISWEEYGEEREADTDDTLSANILHYVFVNENGEKISGEFKAAAPISDCQPIVKGSNIIYYASNANMVDFYSINAMTGQFSKKGYRIAGKNATWKLKNGILTIAGSGEVSIDTKARDRFPVSSTRGFFVSYTDNAWKAIKNKVKKIVIDTGIISIASSAFENFDNLTEVEIKEGLKSIGEKAFYDCNNLNKITIPASVTSIGEDFLWTGFYWMDDTHVVRATIYAPANSYAEKYAKKNGILYRSVEKLNMADASVFGLKKSYGYRGKVWKPTFSVRLDRRTLIKGKDYIVSYKNNKKIGRATVKIKGIGSYNGILNKTFDIVPKKPTLIKLKSLKTRTMKLTWKKDSQSSGYQIQYAGNSKFTKGKKVITIANGRTVSKTISKLSRHKSYYVRLRAYKRVKSKKYYSAWSKIKKVTCR